MYLVLPFLMQEEKIGNIAPRKNQIRSSQSTSHSNSSQITRKCSTASTSSLSHNTHLSSLLNPHLFLSANKPAVPDLVLNWHLIASWPSYRPNVSLQPKFAVLCHPRLLLLSTSSHQSWSLPSSTFAFHSLLGPLIVPSPLTNTGILGSILCVLCPVTFRSSLINHFCCFLSILLSFVSLCKSRALL